MFIRNYEFYMPILFDAGSDYDIPDKLRYDIFPEGFIPAGLPAVRNKRHIKPAK